MIVVGWCLGPWVLIQLGVSTDCKGQWGYIISIICKNAFKMLVMQTNLQYTSTMFIFISIYKLNIIFKMDEWMDEWINKNKKIIINVAIQQEKHNRQRQKGPLQRPASKSLKKRKKKSQ